MKRRYQVLPVSFGTLLACIHDKVPALLSSAFATSLQIPPQEKASNFLLRKNKLDIFKVGHIVYIL